MKSGISKDMATKLINKSKTLHAVKSVTASGKKTTKKK